MNNYENTKLLCDIMSTVACALADNETKRPAEHLTEMLTRANIDVEVSSVVTHLVDLVWANRNATEQKNKAY